MPPDNSSTLPILTTPQPAAGLPSQVPNQTPDPDQIYAAGMKSAAPTSPAAAPNPDDIYNQGMGTSSPAPAFQAPNTSISGRAGGIASLMAAQPQKPESYPDGAASVSDVAKVNTSSHPNEQLQILKSLHPESKPMLEGNVLTYQPNGTGERVPFDGASLNIVKELAQWSGQSVNFVTQGITQLGMTGVGSLLGPWGTVAGYESGLPAAAYLGNEAQSYLQQKWTKIKPDPSQFKEDVQNAMRFNIIIGNVLPAAVMGKELYALKNFSQIDAPKVLQASIKGLLESINGKPLDVRSGAIAGGTNPTPEATTGSRIMGFFDNLHQNLSNQIDKYVGQAVADSKGQKVNLGKGSLATFNRVIREGSQGPNPGMTLDPSGYAVTMPGAAVDVGGGAQIHMGATEPFGVAGQGKPFADMVSRDYNTILGAHKVPAIAGVDMQYLNELTQKYQKIAFGDSLPPGISPSEGMGLDPKLKAQASQIAHQLSEDRLMGMQKFLADPDSKSAVEGIYRNYSQKIDPIKQFNTLARNNQMNPTSIVNALFRPENSQYFQMLKEITSDGVHEGVFNDLRTAWTNEAINNSMTADGTFSASAFRNEIIQVGNDNMATMFSPKENMQLRADTQVLQRLQAMKSDDVAGVNSLARLFAKSTPLTVRSWNSIMTGGSKMLNVFKSKPGLLDAIAGEGMDSVIANSSIKDAAKAVKLKSYLKNFAQSKLGSLSQANQAIRAAAQPAELSTSSAQPQPNPDDIYSKGMGQ